MSKGIEGGDTSYGLENMRGDKMEAVEINLALWVVGQGCSDASVALWVVDQDCSDASVATGRTLGRRTVPKHFPIMNGFLEVSSRFLGRPA